MKKIVAFVLSTVLLMCLMVALTVVGIIVYPKNTFHSSYNSLIQDKFKTLKQTNSRKIIMVAGSSSAFGLNQALLEEKTGYKVVNMGLHAGFGPAFEAEITKANINPGDVVLLGYEPGWHTSGSFKRIGSDLVMSGIDTELEIYKYIPINNYHSLLGYLFTFAHKKNSYKKAVGQYSRDAFDKKSGQMTWPRHYAMSDYKKRIKTYGTINLKDKHGNITISDDAIDYLKKYKKFVEDKGASIYFVSSPILYESVTCSPNDFYKLKREEEKRIGIPFISDPLLYMFPANMMSNAVNHPNSYGELYRTQLLIDDLKNKGIIKSKNLSDSLMLMEGETVALTDTLPKRTLHVPQNLIRVYSRKLNGELIVYEENKDFVIDKLEGSIRRTEKSRIPNYKDHKVIYDNKGKFAWDPKKRSPESNRSYQIEIDYNYYAQKDELEPINDSSLFLSESLKMKLRNKDMVKVFLCGDSIGAGADTTREGNFLEQLKRALEEKYNYKIETKNLSVGGRSRGLLVANLQRIIDEHPDLLLIEFGMNDHCAKNPLSGNNLTSFKLEIQSAVKKLKEKNIDVVLIGFPQQNTMWNVENIDATNKYNKILKEISQENNLFFADVQRIFNQIGLKKNLNEDVFADYIHHPSKWGHQLYVTSLLPLFNLNKDMRPIDLNSYIYYSTGP